MCRYLGASIKGSWLRRRQSTLSSALLTILTGSGRTSSHWAVLSLSGQMMARVSSSSTSAAVPGKLPRPASFKAVRYFLSDQPKVLAPSVTWNGTQRVSSNILMILVLCLYSAWVLQRGSHVLQLHMGLVTAYFCRN